MWEARLNNAVSIVFVHGLQGHAMGTWATSKLSWPKDLLPKDLPAARIMTFEYDTLMSKEPPPQVLDLAKILLDSLTINRRLSRAGSRPLIFVAHSLGGLLVKRVPAFRRIGQRFRANVTYCEQAFLYSQALKLVDKDSFLISVATKACIFFGTPHIKSSEASWTQMRWQITEAVAAQSLAFQRSPTRMLMSTGTEDMLKLSADFCLRSGQIKLISIYETLMTSTICGKLWVSRSNCDGVLILTKFARWYRERMLL